MQYPYENLRINQNIVTYTIFQVDKMPDMFLDVEFTYPRCKPWKTCVPIFEKYQGINYIESPSEDVIAWIKQCYDDMSPSNSNAWTQGE